MARIRVGSFNLENLFLRYRILDKEKGSRTPKPVDPDKFVAEGGHINMLGRSIEDYGPIAKSLRKLTAKIILDNDPDILAVQEVENLEALFLFNSKYLKHAYPYYLLIDGNDGRGIDVGLLSKHPIVSACSHQYGPPETKNRVQKTFSRDCLEATVRVSGKDITLFINHFTSRISDADGTKRRDPQSAAVVEIVKKRFGAGFKTANWVICGDFNALPDEKAVTQMEKGVKAENVINRLPEDERWTYIYKKANQQLDYLMVSPSLAKASDAVPTLDRRGLPEEKRKYNPEQTEYLAEDGASDHCPIFMDLKL